MAYTALTLEVVPLGFRYCIMALTAMLYLQHIISFGCGSMHMIGQHGNGSQHSLVYEAKKTQNSCGMMVYWWASRYCNNILNTLLATSGEWIDVNWSETL